jgi:preprotein translocase subunit SecF
MQILQNVNIDWLGKTKYFVMGSLVLLLAGVVAMYQDGGPLYGIDFKGGTLVYVRFAQAPPLDGIRSGLAQRGQGESIIQRIGPADANEVVIQLEQQGDQDEALDRGKNMILEVLGATVTASGETGKRDFNAADATAIADALTMRDPLTLGATAGDRYQQLGTAIAAFRDTQRSGLVTNLDELTQVTDVNPAVVGALKESFFTGPYAIRNVEIVGPRVGAQLRAQAFWATVYALIGMLIYIAFRFEWVYGTAAVLAVVHDVLMTLGFFAIFNYEISLTVIAALLTLVGFSMNDTIVIFDRMRENLRISRRESLAVIANKSINQTLSRTVLTNGTTFVTVLILFIFGGEVLRSFAFALTVGVVIGTYSTVGIAAALVVAWDKWKHSRGAGANAASGPSSRARQDQPEETRTLAAAGRR